MGFTRRRLRINAPSEIKAITGIYHSSSYCSVSYTSSKITLTSEKAGNAYIYLNGILNINDNKAVILYIVFVAENGSLSTGEPYIFSTDPNFTKIPTTIQKELGTTSSTDGLDTSEPEDNPNITPFVNTEEVNQKFVQFENEDNILPKVFVAFCINKNKWCINYTNDTTITEKSDYNLYETTYDGLLDCLNKAFGLLTSNRTTKEKVIVINSGSTGTAKQNMNSKVHRNNRNPTSVSILPSSYTILDFQDNYIYVDRSEPFTSGTTTYNIGVVIDMERGIKYVTISNLTIIGRYSYGIFLAQCSEIYFKNIHITIAQGEFESSYIGIRAQSMANAIANVELSRWSHDLYFDNCTFNGVGDHGIETFNAYNIWGKRIESTDLGGCGILLNCSYNVWINEVIAKRCCAQATYAAVRFANDAGPNINIHYVYGEGCGNGVFLVSSSNDINIDKINLVNIHSTPVYVGGSAGLHLQSGKIITNGGVLKYNNSGEIGTTNATTGNAIFLVNGSSSQFLPQWNDVFENITIEGFNSGYSERYNMSSNYNIYNNIDTTKCKTAKSGASNGGGTDEDKPFNFCVIDGEKGEGYDEITGEKIVSGDYTYALARDEQSYVIMDYNGTDQNIIIPSVYNEKPVSRIGSFSFYAKETIKQVTINSNIKTLGGLCFGACPNLETVIFSSGGTCEVGHCAFRGCKKLKNLDLTGASILRASSFAWCTGLTEVVCPRNVVYFGANVFYNCNINLTIECDDISLMTVEPYAFYFMGFNSKIEFTGISKPTSVIGVAATGSNSYYYNSQNYVEKVLYKPGVWCKYYYHVAIEPKFKS